jgi:hypothetical protein
MKIDLISSNAQLHVLSGALAAARPHSSEVEKFQNRNTCTFMARHVSFEWVVRVHWG